MDSYNSLISKAIEIKRQKKFAANTILEKNLENLRQCDPEFAEIETLIAKNGNSILSAAFCGDANVLNDLTTIGKQLVDKKDKKLAVAGINSAPYECVACGDSGKIDGKRCDCITKIAKDLHYKSLCSKMPLEFSTFDKFNLNFYSDKLDETGYAPKKVAERALEVCKEFADIGIMNGKNLLLCGGSGLGKTHLSLAIINNAVQQGFSVIYGPAQHIIDAITNDRFYGSNSQNSVQAINECDLLVIDDLGTEMITSVSRSIIGNIINTRLLETKATIISTNLTLKEIEEYYDPRVASRIIGSYTMRLLIGKDIRQQKALSTS